MMFYKYMSLEKFERFIDVLINKRLYAACYRDLNDPFEGEFNWRSMEKKRKVDFFKTMSKARICSLQVVNEEAPSNNLMWAHYADAHKGCCLKVSVDVEENEEWIGVPMNYRDVLPIIEEKDLKLDVQEVLSYKSKEWSYENEYRFIRFFDKKPNEKVYINVKIDTIYLGQKMIAKDKEFYAKLIRKMDSSIKIKKMIKGKDVDFYPNLNSI